jgi:HK97 family phage major capsid protein
VPNPVLQRLVDERTQTQDNIDRILDRSNEEERDPTDSERELINGHRERLQQLEPMIGELLEVEETRGKAKAARAALTRTRRETPEGEGEGEGGGGNGGEGGEEGEYRTFAHYARDQMLVRHKQIAAQVEPHVRQRAQQRLQRAVEQVLTSNIAGLQQPQYIAQIMQVISRSRPIVESSRQLGLTSGKLQFPRISARPTVAVQATEKTEVGTGTMTVDMVEKVAKTFMTSANLSWQTIQWSNPDALALWLDLAAESYAKQTDADVATLLAAADATPTLNVPDTLEGWTGAIADAAGRIYGATGRYADTVYSDPATGYGIIGLVSASQPVFLPTGGGNLAAGTYPTIGGLRLVISKGLPADVTVVGDSQAILTAENAGAPVDLRMVEPSIGGMEIGIIGAFAAELVEVAAFEELHTGAT